MYHRVYLASLPTGWVCLPTYGLGMPPFFTRFTVGGVYPGVPPEHLSERKPGNIKTGQKTLEWSTILDKLVVLTVFDKQVLFPGERRGEAGITTFNHF